jgi:hypothetical protein
MKNAPPDSATQEKPMPIAQAENPPELSAPDIQSITGPWCVVKAKSKREKVLAAFLLEHGIDYFLPYVQGSRDGILLPMFSGFLFMSFPSSNRWELDLARSSTHVFGYLHTDNQPRLKNEIAFIASETSLNRTLKLESSIPRKGQPVRFTKGIYKNFIGTINKDPIQDKQGRIRVFVLFMLMGQLASKLVRPDELEVLLP